MLRWATLNPLFDRYHQCCIRADQIVTPHAKRHVAGSCRPGCLGRTINTGRRFAYGAPAARGVYGERDPDCCLRPTDGPGGYIQNLPGTPLFPGSAARPGYYGRAFSYDYQGPYYGGPICRLLGSPGPMPVASTAIAN